MAYPEMIPAAWIDRAIVVLRDCKVLMDRDLAALYGVSMKDLNQAVKRNLDRFPPDFMLQLTDEEVKACLKSPFVTSSGRGGRRHRPYVFTEQGVAMLSSVLHSERAVQVNIEIMRTFVRLRQMLATHAELARKLEALERRYDARFKVVFDAIRKLMEPPPDLPRRPIGFLTEAERKPSGRRASGSRRRSPRRVAANG